jgi:hypothetical protein
MMPNPLLALIIGILLLDLPLQAGHITHLSAIVQPGIRFVQSVFC